ncbi:hypothetical protein BJY52DRAFT_404382 [Lactarius psammicola]|nr:hypothetical protein BJY52DRAFT_404382 [Lactarius psammicola]
MRSILTDKFAFSFLPNSRFWFSMLHCATFLFYSSSRGRQKGPVVLRRWCWLFISGMARFLIFSFGLLVSHYLLHHTCILNHSIHIVSVLSPLSHPTRSIFTACCHHPYIYDCCDTVGLTLLQCYLLFPSPVVIRCPPVDRRRRRK